MRDKKGLFGEPLVFLMAFIFIIMAFVVFFSFFKIDSDHNKYVIEKAGGEVGDNLFLLGIMRSNVEIDNNEEMMISDLLARYAALKDDSIKTAVATKINEITEEAFSKKVCWNMRFSSYAFGKKTDCEELYGADKINAKLVIPGYNEETITVDFKTIK